MSKNTFFHTRFWQDSYISSLDPIEKLLFNYCLTSPFLSLSGIYEVPIKYIAVETGIENSMVTKILDRFEADNKIVYSNGWLCILNYPKYQSYNLPNVKKGLEKELSSVPEEILSFFIIQGYNTTSIGNALPSYCQGLGTKEREREQGNGIGKGIKKSKPKNVSDYPESFETFWKSYPRKVSKGEAWKSWNKLKPPLDIVLKALEDQKLCDQWQKDGGKFIPHPTTWLNGRRWEDEVEIKNTSTKYSKYDD